MTQKRFIKLLMSNGYSRNKAYEIAKQIPPTGSSYAEIYNSNRVMLRVNLNFAKIKLNISKVSDSFLRVAAALAKFTAAVTPTMARASLKIQNDQAKEKGINNTELNGYGFRISLCDEYGHRLHEMEQLAIDAEGAEHGQPAL